ncbi:OST-HTH/LOTUS domain-containing protein [Novosphingobium kunmingense]|nr:OST-HTH/LOTUS domain-containing protein [Novosphingobium kunmingense]
MQFAQLWVKLLRHWPQPARTPLIKRQAPIDPRNYGARTFTELMTATGLFDLVKLTDGRIFVADKRNKDRAAKPSA